MQGRAAEDRARRAAYKVDRGRERAGVQVQVSAAAWGPVPAGVQVQVSAAAWGSVPVRAEPREHAEVQVREPVQAAASEPVPDRYWFWALIHPMSSSLYNSKPRGFSLMADANASAVMSPTILLVLVGFAIFALSFLGSSLFSK